MVTSFAPYRPARDGKCSQTFSCAFPSPLQKPRPFASYFPAGTAPKALDLLQKVNPSILPLLRILLSLHDFAHSCRYLLPIHETMKMLTFHPEYRITVEEALEHPYLEELHSQMDEPVSTN